MLCRKGLVGDKSAAELGGSPLRPALCLFYLNEVQSPVAHRRGGPPVGLLRLPRLTWHVESLLPHMWRLRALAANGQKVVAAATTGQLEGPWHPPAPQPGSPALISVPVALRCLF